MSNTKRVDIQHLVDLSPVKSAALFNTILRNNMLIGTLKIDGVGFRFGKDATGKKFVESSYSGVIYDPNDFVEYAKANNKDMRIATAYKNLSLLLFKSRVMNRIKSNTKIVCEVLYEGLNQSSDPNTVKNVHLEYSKSVLSKKGLAVFIITELDFTTGSTLMNSSYHDFSDDYVTVYDKTYVQPMYHNSSSDLLKLIKHHLDEFKSLTDFKTKAARDMKPKYIESLQTISGMIYKLSKDQLGSISALSRNVEGFVFNDVKVVDPAFKQMIADKRAANKGA
jgi:hypothetical protein